MPPVERKAILLARTVWAGSAGMATDLSSDIMAALDRQSGPVARRIEPSAVRAALVAVALVQLIMAIPAVFLGRDAGAPIHVAREAGSFEVALAVGFLFIAWRPARAYGVLPLVAALVSCLAATTFVDLARGGTQLLDESAHLLDFIGLAAVWLLARIESVTNPAPLRTNSVFHPEVS